MKIFLKKYGWIFFWVIILAVGFFIYRINKTEPGPTYVQNTDTTIETMHRLTDTYDAISDIWTADDDIKYTIDLQNQLIGDKPIVVLTSIEDIYNIKDKYFLKSDIWTLSDNTYTLNVECTKDIVDSVAEEIGQSGNKFVFVAKINEITSPDINSEGNLSAFIINGVCLEVVNTAGPKL